MAVRALFLLQAYAARLDCVRVRWVCYEEFRARCLHDVSALVRWETVQQGFLFAY